MILGTSIDVLWKVHDILYYADYIFVEDIRFN